MGLEGPPSHKECEGCWGLPEVWRDTTAFPGILTGTTSLVTARLGDFKPLVHGTVRTDFYYLPTLYLETKTVLFCEHFFFWFVCRSVCLCVCSRSQCKIQFLLWIAVKGRFQNSPIKQATRLSLSFQNRVQNKCKPQKAWGRRYAMSEGGGGEQWLTNGGWVGRATSLAAEASELVAHVWD